MGDHDAVQQVITMAMAWRGAYNAALQTANMAIACAGYRVTAKAGHHKVTVEAITLAVGAAVSPHADYFETCRRKRNVIDYTRSQVATDSESDEM